MIPYFEDYFWKDGKPYGLKPIDPIDAAHSYKIVVDPYYKRFSIEKYHYGIFQNIIYDSSLLDFRHLRPIYQTAWQKEILQCNDEKIVHLIRNEDDRAILTESLYFENGRAKSCKIYSIHQILIASHEIFYADWGDNFNGVIFSDSQGKQVMIKKYSLDSTTNEFSELLEENWNLCRK